MVTKTKVSQDKPHQSVTSSENTRNGLRKISVYLYRYSIKNAFFAKGYRRNQ